MDTITRRRFLTASGVVAGRRARGRRHRLRAARHPGQHRRRPAGGKTLVLVTLYGGCDGLNTVIPYADEAYAAARPGLSYTGDQVLRLDDSLGLNPGLKGLHKLYGEERLADRARGRLSEAGSQSLPVDGHLADRAAGAARHHRLAGPLAGPGGRRPAAGGLLRAGAAAAAGRGEQRGGDGAGRRGEAAEDGDAGAARRRSRPASAGETAAQARAAGCFADLIRVRDLMADVDAAEDDDAQTRRRPPPPVAPLPAGHPARPGRQVHRGGRGDPGLLGVAGRVRPARRREERDGVAAGQAGRAAVRVRRADGRPGRGGGRLLRVRPPGEGERLGRHRPRDRVLDVPARRAGSGAGCTASSRA